MLVSDLRADMQAGEDACVSDSNVDYMFCLRITNNRRPCEVSHEE